MQKSCGFIIKNVDGKVLIAHPTNDYFGEGIWVFPKGLIERGETELQCALREVYEETNLDLLNISGKISYLYTTPEWNGRLVVYFLFQSNVDLKRMKIKCNSIVEEICDDAGNPIYENDDFAWLDIQDCIQYLGYRDKDVTEKYLL